MLNARKEMRASSRILAEARDGQGWVILFTSKVRVNVVPPPTSSPPSKLCGNCSSTSIGNPGCLNNNGISNWIVI